MPAPGPALVARMATIDDVERSALAACEELFEHTGNAAFRQRLMADLPDEVRARVIAIERSNAAAASALPTLIPGSADCDAELPPPARIGAFRLVRRVGRGGMGDVWLGERADELFEQKAAIKLIQRRVLARAADAFDAERRFLARFEHPGIARIIDGGLTEDGLPWLAMDYVEGQPIDAGCAARGLAECLAIFVAAARAVQFVHGQLVAHGDIKPANILVTADGRPKLLDFGIARLIGDDVALANPNPGRAAPGLAPFTPGFASPERCAGGPPSVADDVFALGRTLERVIEGRGADAELTAIADKAVASAETRYSSVEALIADLLRWEARLPVSAMPDRALYRARKFVQRHRTGLIFTTLTAIALAVTALVAMVNYVRAERERTVAAARFADAHRVAHYLMFDLMDQLERRPGTLALRARIGSVAHAYLDRLSRSPNGGPAIKLDIANGYLRSGILFGIGTSSNFGDYARGKKDLARAHAMLTQLARDPTIRDKAVAPLLRVAWLECQMQIYGDHDAARALTVAREGLKEAAELTDPAGQAVARWPLRICEGDALVWLERTSEAIPLLQAELAAGRRRQPPDMLMIARNLRFLGEAYFYAKRYPEAETAFVEALDLLTRAHQAQPFFQGTVNEYSGVSDDLASTYSEQKRFADQLRVAKAGMDLASAQAALDRNDLQSERRALALARLVADALAGLGRKPEAIAMMEEVNARWAALAGRFPTDAALARLRLMSLQVEGDLRRGAGQGRAACAIYRRTLDGWGRFGRRWTISPSDQEENVVVLRGRVAGCSAG
jgi:serine/threonine-protein kinase